jgi:hypothetical protein
MMGRMRNSVSFAQAYPDYVNQWHPANTSKPESTARSSNVKVLWQCPDIPSHTCLVANTVDALSALETK